jgi:maleate isomerase
VDAVVISACVQMPSLSAVQEVEDELGMPVVSAATATARSLLLALGITPRIHGAGQLLAGG